MICNKKQKFKTKKWLEELQINAKQNCIVVIVGTKYDLVEQTSKTKYESIEKFAETIESKFFMTSAKSNTGIEELFIYLMPSIHLFITIMILPII